MPNYSDMSTEELQAILATRPQKAPAENQLGRTFAQGVTYNFADEIEAAVRSVLPESMGGGDYREIKKDITQKLLDYKKENPTESITAELAGAMVPAALTMGIPGVREANLRRLAVIGGGEALTSYVGQLDSPPDMDDLVPAAMTTVAGATAGPIVQSGIGATGAIGKRLVNFTRETFGSKPSDAVQAELRRLAEGTGKTVDEIAQDVIDGRIMAENRTLQASVRALRSKGGQAGAEITETLPARRKATRQEAVSSMQDGLAPGADNNVIRQMKASDQRLAQQESEAYRSVWGEVPEVNVDVAREMEGVIQRFPDVRGELDKLYGERNLVPLFAADDAGGIRLSRIPTLEDAEILRRSLDDQAGALYRGGSGTRGEAASEAAKSLRARLDTDYPQLAGVRAQARERRVIRDRFDEGRKALGANADEVEVAFEEASKQGDAAVRAFRAGVMDAIRNRSRRSPSLMGRLADADRQEGSVLRIVFPEDSVDDIQRKLEIASGSEELYNKVLFNSMTSPEQTAAASIGSGTSMTDVARVFGGDPLAAVQMLGKKIADATPNSLSESQRLDVARVLLSEDPQFVLRALTDNTMMDELMRRTARVANLGGAYVRTVGTQQGGGLLAELQGEQ